MIAELLYNLTDLINTSFKEGSIPMAAGQTYFQNAQTPNCQIAVYSS